MLLGQMIRAGIFMAAVATTIYFGVISDSPLPDNRYIVGYNDVVLHAAAFAAIAFVSMIGASRTGMVLVLLVAAAGGIELIQIFKPARSASIEDFGSSVAGILLGWALAVVTSHIAARIRNLLV